MSEGLSLECSVEKVATKNPKTIKDKNILASDALRVIENHKIQLLLVLNDDNSLAGVLHIHDLIEAGIK